VLDLFRHVFNCLVQNEPGVLSRVSGILAARGFNIGAEDFESYYCSASALIVRCY
jgi:acetolactate synthase regulatory subunit